MSTRKLIGKVSATEKNPSSCDEFQFWLSDDTILSPFDIVLVHNKTDDSITYGVVQDIFHITDGTGHISNYVSSDFGNVDIAPMTRRLSLSYAKVSVIHNTKENFMPVFKGSAVYTAFEMKTLADAGRVGTEAYSISADFKMEGTRETNGNVHDGIYYVFGATSAAETDFYQAFIDFSSFLNGTNAPKMTVTKGSEPNVPILEVDLSNLITTENYKDTHNFKIDVISANKINYYLDGQMIGSTTTIDATMENATFGFKITGNTNDAMLLPITKAEVTNLCVQTGDRILCDSDDLKNINTTVTNASSRGYTIKDDVYYPSVASKEYPAYLYGVNTYTENRYR
ncbi:MAG: hypothetical protein DBX37_00425, partial [Massilioclostridium sp.]